MAQRLDGTKELTRAQRTKLYMETGDKRFLRPPGPRKKFGAGLFRRQPGDPIIVLPEPTPQERAKRKALIGELRKVTGDPKYDGVAHLPPDHVGSRWHAVKNRKPGY